MSANKYLAPIGILQEPNDSLETLPDPREMRERQVMHLRLLWDHRRLLFRCVACGFLFSVLVALLIPSRYQATTQLMPPDNQSGTGALLSAVAGRAGAGTLSGFAGDLLGAKNSGALFVGILSSRTVRDRLIQQFDLRRVYGGSKMEDARERLAEHTSLSEDRKSGIITIGVSDHDPERAAAMAQAYVSELDRLVAEVSTSSARRERIFLDERLHDVKGDLDAAAKNFSEFASKNTAIDIPAQGKAMVEAAATLQGQLIAAQSELSGLQQVYTANNVRVRSLQARVNELRQQLDKLGGADMSGGAKGDNSLYPSIRKLPILGVTYADLYRQTKIQETVYELLTQQYELAKVEEAKEIPAVKVLDAAIVPTRKSFPPRMVIVFLGTVFAFVLAATFVLGNQAWTATDADDPRKALAREVFSTVSSRVPFISKNGSGVYPVNGHGWHWRSWRDGSNKEQPKQE
ncbi:MAG TPA: Wzz/FepE/Etk N-terminal domain-containing protein [Terriglobia bacterium]|nr:Wzz/FepE/Etk N-terminal domain-containing protein [Candidatus Acidoferrum sp.]HMD85313.1 Wzz/FepE/Etk N-terminal domain-containing protein [Terriglobia bacterium]